MMNLWQSIKALTPCIILGVSVVACGGGGSEPEPDPISTVPSNNAPVLSPQSFNVDEDTVLQDTVMASDPDGDAITYSLISTTTQGTLSVDSNGTINYQANSDYFGDDSFVVQVSDGLLTSQQVEISIVIRPVNDAPVLQVLNNLVVDEDNNLASLLSASDVDGDNLIFSLVQSTSNGEINVNADGTFTYLPNLNFNGPDSFIANVSDGNLATELAFNIAISAVNDAPVLQVLNNLIVDEDTNLASLLSASDFNGLDSFVANVSDGDLTTELAFSIEISAINDAPTFTLSEKVTRLDQAITFSLDAEDVDGDILSYQIISQPSNGVAVLNEDNTVTYTPNSGTFGFDEFEVEASDQELNVVAIAILDNDLAFQGQISGVAEGVEDVEVFLTANGVLLEATPDSSGEFKFYGLADGDYAIKVKKPGFKSAPSVLLELDINDIEKNAKNNQQQNGQYNKAGVEAFVLEELTDSSYTFHWEEDQSTAGYDYAAHINEPIVIEFLDEQLEVVDDSSSNQLHHDYNILLTNSSNEATAKDWTQEHAYRILEIMKSIPQDVRDDYAAQSLTPSKWELTTDFIEDDVQITTSGNHKTVLISEAAFVNATPKVALVDGKRGIYYSQKLHHALVRFITDNGNDVDAYEKILNERFGVTTVINDYPAITASTTAEDSGRFQAFHPEEIVQIINMFEEMPKGMHILPELQYLLRRLDGTPHPLYGEAPAVAWSTSGYIEFMESAFNTSSVEHMHRLVIHEKAHFLWENQFSEELKNDWIELGGWFVDAESDSGWSTTKQTEFVSAYAHSKNPNEDMAESVSYFIINPDLLKSRAIGKYEFVRDFIMQGNIYISQIREDLTFEVYNLYPDYVFPGKIKRIDISVEGEAEEDKVITVELELHALDTDLEGANHGQLRLFSEIGTFEDLGLSPVMEDGTIGQEGVDLSSILRGSFTLSKLAKAGFWRTSQITVTDAVGNQRMSGANDFGWKLYVNNPLEDISKPEYVLESAILSKSESVITENGIDYDIQIIHASWEVNEDTKMRDGSACYASLNDEILTTYSIGGWGEFSEESQTCSVDLIMPHYMPSSNYSMNFILMFDEALNISGTYFTDPNHGLREEDVIIDEAPQEVELITNNQDLEAPELDLNDIQISAEPTNPTEPNGETEVTITFKVRDNNSGYRNASLNLRDPQGIDHYYGVPSDDQWTLFPTDDPSEWNTYGRTILLPTGSAPGTWGLSEMTVVDRAGNFKGYDFTEIVHFDVEE